MRAWASEKQKREKKKKKEREELYLRGLHAGTGSKKRSTHVMAPRILNPNFPSSHKEEVSHFSAHFRKSSQSLYSPRSPCTSHSPCSPYSPRHHISSIARKHSPRSSQPILEEMTIDISPTLQRWLHDKGLTGYIRVAEAPPNPNSQDMPKKLNVDTITNTNIRKKLGQSGNGKRHFEIPPARVLECYFGEYSISAKAYMTRNASDPFFRELAKFLLEVRCVHANAYGMPK